MEWRERFGDRLFYGDASQLVAQLVGVATLVGFVSHSASSSPSWWTCWLGNALPPNQSWKALTFRRWARWPIRNSS